MNVAGNLSKEMSESKSLSGFHRLNRFSKTHLGFCESDDVKAADFRMGF